MRVIISDSCALIDLKKGALLEAFLDSAFDVIVPDMMLADELLSFTKAEIALMRRKMTVADLDSDQMARMHVVQRTNPALTVYDCAVLVIAERRPGAIVLIGDRRLRALAESAGVDCHGVPWVVDELMKAHLATRKRLLSALEAWKADVLVRLPCADIERRIARLKNR